MTEAELLQEIINTLNTNHQDLAAKLQVLQDSILSVLQQYNTFLAVALLIIIFLLVVLVVRSM